MARNSRLKDHHAEQRLFGRRVVAATFVIMVLLGALFARALLPAGGQARLLQRTVAGQPHPHRADPAAARPDPRSQRRTPRAQSTGVPAGTHARADTRRRRHAGPARGARPAAGRRRGAHQARDHGAARVRRRAGPPAAVRGGTRALRGASTRLPGRRDPAAAHAATIRTAGVGVHALGYVAAISEQDQERIDVAKYAGTTLIGKLGIERNYEDAAARRDRLPAAAGQCAGPSRRPRRRQGAGPATQGADRGQRPLPHDRPHAAAGGRGGARHAAGGGRRDRSPQRRRARLRQHADVRPQRLRARPHRAGIPRARGQHRQAADRPRAARRLPAGFHDQAVRRAGRAAVRRHGRGRDALLPRCLAVPGLEPQVPRLEEAGPRHGRHAQGDRAVVRHLFLRRVRPDRHRPPARLPGPVRAQREDGHRHTR